MLQLKIISKYKAEAAANNAVFEILDMQDEFSPDVLKRGVTIVGVKLDISPLPAASAANTRVQTEAQVTRKEETTILSTTNSGVLVNKLIWGYSGSAAGAVMQAGARYAYGKDGLIPSVRRFKMTSQNSEVYYGLGGVGEGAVNSAVWHFVTAYDDGTVPQNQSEYAASLRNFVSQLKEYFSM